MNRTHFPIVLVSLCAVACASSCAKTCRNFRDCSLDEICEPSGVCAPAPPPVIIEGEGEGEGGGEGEGEGDAGEGEGDDGINCPGDDTVVLNPNTIYLFGKLAPGVDVHPAISRADDPFTYMTAFQGTNGIMVEPNGDLLVYDGIIDTLYTWTRDLHPFTGDANGNGIDFDDCAYANVPHDNDTIIAVMPCADQVFTVIPKPGVEDHFIYQCRGHGDWEDQDATGIGFDSGFSAHPLVYSPGDKILYASTAAWELQDVATKTPIPLTGDVPPRATLLPEHAVGRADDDTFYMAGYLVGSEATYTLYEITPDGVSTVLGTATMPDGFIEADPTIQALDAIIAPDHESIYVHAMTGTDPVGGVGDATAVHSILRLHLDGSFDTVMTNDPTDGLQLELGPNYLFSGGSFPR